MTVLADEFSRVFREEHRRVRDLLLELIEAFEGRDVLRIRSLLGEIAGLTGPHFRYEEEALYPALVQIFGSPYIDRLYRDHDAAIAAAKRLVELAGSDELDPGEVSEAVQLVRGILPHVTDCDGLSIMVEVLPAESVRSIFAARDRSLGEGLDLLRWAQEVRGRPGAARA